MGTEKNLQIAMPRVLVTGGGGFVGKAVVKSLLDLGIIPTVIGRNRYVELERLGIPCIRGSVADPQSMDNACRGKDLVFHVAAKAGIWGPWNDYHRTNVIGTRTVVESCRKNGVAALVYTSTPSVVFDRRDICGQGEDELDYASAFLCHYARSKAIAERIVLGADSPGLQTIALRPHLIWGPGDPHLLPRLIASGQSKTLQQVGDGTNIVDISYIDNVAEAHLCAAARVLEAGSVTGKAYFISQGEPVNLWQWVNELFDRLGIAPVEKSVSFTKAFRIGMVLEGIHRFLPSRMEPRMTRFLALQLAKSHYFSIDNARTELGYIPRVSTEEGLQRTVEWLPENC